MIVTPGSTSISVDVKFLDDSGFALTGKVAADFPACKWSGGTNVASSTITLSDLAAITTAHPNNNTAGGIKEREGGWYRLDLPNNMLTSAGRKTLTFAETTDKRIIAPTIDCQYVQSDAAKINGVATTSVTTIGANIGTTQPVNFLGTGGSALVGSFLGASSISSGTFQAGALDAVWSTAARTLTAATNITSTGGTITVSSGGVSLSTASLRQVTGFKNVVWIDTTDDLKATVEAQSAGTLCWLRPGIYDLGSSNIVCPDGVSIVGSGNFATRIKSTHASLAGLKPGSNAVYSDFTFDSTGGLGPIGISPTQTTPSQTAATNVLFRRLHLIGISDIVFILNDTVCEFDFEDCTGTSEFDCIVAGSLNHSTAHKIWLDGVEFHSRWVDNGSNASRGIAVSDYSELRGKNVHLFARDGSTTTHGIRCDTNARVELNESSITVTGTSSSKYAIYQATSGVVILNNCEFDRSLVTGTITDRKSPRLDTSNSAYAVDSSGAAIAPASATTAISAKLGTPAGASVSADIAEIQAATGSPVSPFNVDKDHTWTFQNQNQITSPNILSESIGFDGLVAMDFDKPIPALSSISSVSAATFANIAGTEPTVSDTAVSADKRKANITIDCSAATAGTYTLSVTIVTTDSQTFVRKGQITIS